MLIQILSHTPRWVFAVFALLVWVGSKQLFAGRVSMTRVTVMPIAMTGLSIQGVISAFGTAPGPLLGWVVAAAAFLVIVMQRPPSPTTHYDAATHEFQVPGSAVPLALMMGIFLTKYVVGVLLAMHPELRHQSGLALGISTLYGAFCGVFSARALRLWRLALREDRAAIDLAPARV